MCSTLHQRSPHGSISEDHVVDDTTKDTQGRGCGPCREGENSNKREPLPFEGNTQEVEVGALTGVLCSVRRDADLRSFVLVTDANTKPRGSKDRGK